MPPKHNGMRRRMGSAATLKRQQHARNMHATCKPLQQCCAHTPAPCACAAGAALPWTRSVMPQHTSSAPARSTTFSLTPTWRFTRYGSTRVHNATVASQTGSVTGSGTSSLHVRMALCLRGKLIPSAYRILLMCAHESYHQRSVLPLAQIDFLEHSAVKDVIVCSVVLEEVSAVAWHGTIVRRDDCVCGKSTDGQHICRWFGRRGSPRIVHAALFPLVQRLHAQACQRPPADCCR